jgi:hypothetical protein
VDASNNIHRVIIDAGNEKILSTMPFPFAIAGWKRYVLA